MEKSVSPAAATCARSGGASSRTLVTSATRARSSARGVTSSAVRATAASRTGNASAPSRPSSGAPATIATGTIAATTIDAAVVTVLAQRATPARFRRRRRGARSVMPNATSRERVSGTWTSIRRGRRRPAVALFMTIT